MPQPQQEPNKDGRAADRPIKPTKGIAMEGMIAAWYTRVTARDLAEFERLARRIAGELPPGARVLEVAPGPGYLAVAMARLGLAVVGLDISASFVRIAAAHARSAGVAVEFRQGDAAAMPFAAAAFDFVVCRAAFKNFGDPAGALAEMHRVLVPDGRALILDMRGDTSDAEIAGYAQSYGRSVLDRLTMRLIFRSLRKRAYTAQPIGALAQALDGLAAQVPFARRAIVAESIGMEVRLDK
jgi:ubiquinone/menaquinone biosynthesis C-methylase UbiE